MEFCVVVVYNFSPEGLELKITTTQNSPSDHLLLPPFGQNPFMESRAMSITHGKKYRRSKWASEWVSKWVFDFLSGPVYFVHGSCKNLFLFRDWFNITNNSSWFLSFPLPPQDLHGCLSKRIRLELSRPFFAILLPGWMNTTEQLCAVHLTLGDLSM